MVNKDYKCLVCGASLLVGLNNSLYICKSCEKRYPIKKDKDKFNEQYKLKLDVMSHYVEDELECACCGESHIEFLTIDHINNDGAKHRKENNIKTSRQLYRWIQKNNYPDGFRVLCFNCNAARGFFGNCPHEYE